MLLNIFDFLIISILIYWNIKHCETKQVKVSGCLLNVLLYGIVLPIISMLIELQRLGKFEDSFTAAYVFLRFPTYWGIGFVIGLIADIACEAKDKKRTKNNAK